MNPVARTLALCLLLHASCAGASDGEPAVRTDINPALRYYQAYLETPRLNDEDHRFLLETDWRGKPLDKRFHTLIARYDVQFKFLTAAAQARVPCDWGIDLTDGPGALLPGLAPAKACAVAARLRMRWHLESNRPGQAVEEFGAVLALARNVSRDGILISTLVQIAMEHILFSGVAQEFHRWPAASLLALQTALDEAPARGTVGRCVSMEKEVYYGWLVRRLDEIKRANPGDEVEAVRQFQELLAQITGESGLYPSLSERLMRASGGTLTGIESLMRDLAPQFDALARIMALPHGSYEVEMAAFTDRVRADANPLAVESFDAMGKSRTREFAALAQEAMLKAAIQYRVHGPEGLNRVRDPFGTGPFGFRRIVFQGEDRGFELRSAYAGRNDPHHEVQTFVEKDGPPFVVDFRTGEVRGLGATERK